MPSYGRPVVEACLEKSGYHNEGVSWNSVRARAGEETGYKPGLLECCCCLYPHIAWLGDNYFFSSLWWLLSSQSLTKNCLMFKYQCCQNSIKDAILCSWNSWRFESLCKKSLIGKWSHANLNSRSTFGKSLPLCRHSFFFQWQEKWDMGDIHQNPDILDRRIFLFLLLLLYDLLACLNGKSRTLPSRKTSTTWFPKSRQIGYVTKTLNKLLKRRIEF